MCFLAKKSNSCSCQCCLKPHFPVTTLCWVDQPHLLCYQAQFGAQRRRRKRSRNCNSPWRALAVSSISGAVTFLPSSASDHSTCFCPSLTFPALQHHPSVFRQALPGQRAPHEHPRAPQSSPVLSLPLTTLLFQGTQPAVCSWLQHSSEQQGLQGKKILKKKVPSHIHKRTPSSKPIPNS